jgi:DNA polymerase III subunit delta'
MAMTSLNMDSFIGNAPAVAILKRAIELNRFPHALILSGPVGVGKCTLAILLAQYLNCLSPSSAGACGACSVCRRIMAIHQSRYLDCLSSKGESYCGSCAHCKIRSARHPDVWLIEPEKTTISIEQVRRLIGEIAFQPFEARYRVVIFDPAEQMRTEAHNSLLKTLEEPASRTVLILVTPNPHALPVTILSRSRLVHFGSIPQEQIENHLVEKAGRLPEESRLAAALSGGSLRLALDFDSSRFRDQREKALCFVSLMLSHRGFSEGSTLAAEVAKDKESFLLWLESAAALLQDVFYLQVAPPRVGQRDLVPRLSELARATPRSEVVSALKGIKKLRAGLQFNINRQIALEALLLSESSHS